MGRRKNVSLFRSRPGAPHQTVALRNAGPRKSFRYAALPNRGPPSRQHPPIESNRKLLRYAGPRPRSAGCATLSRGQQETLHQNVARRRRKTKLWPAGDATPTRGPQDMADKRVGNKGEGECCSRRGCQMRGQKIRGWVLRARGVSGRSTSSAASNFNSLKLNVSSCRGHCSE